MSTTPISLLDRLKGSQSSEAWSQFVELYTPLIHYWGKKLGIRPAELSDFVQDIFSILIRELPSFKYRADQRFRGWLWTVVLNKRRERFRRESARPTLMQDSALIETLEQADETLQIDVDEYRRFLVERALMLMQSEFETNTWRACWESVVNDRKPKEIAAELGISENAVHIARSRVLRRLRRDLVGLLD